MKAGDQVRLKQPDTVYEVRNFYGAFESQFVELSDGAYYVGTVRASRVEVVEQTFGPGDVVKNIATGMVYTLGENGCYFDHQSRRWGMAGVHLPWTSVHYTKLEPKR